MPEATPEEVKEFAESLVKEAEEAEERRRLRRPKWMRERPKRSYLSESERKARRERNKARARLRPLMRKRRRHGRPVGR